MNAGKLAQALGQAPALDCPVAVERDSPSWATLRPSGSCGRKSGPLRSGRGRRSGYSSTVSPRTATPAGCASRSANTCALYALPERDVRCRHAHHHLRAARGEPRGPALERRPIRRQRALGHCVDCGICVQVCPTGIDIPPRLQYECIGCAALHRRCNQVMEPDALPAGPHPRTPPTTRCARRLCRDHVLRHMMRPARSYTVPCCWPSWRHCRLRWPCAFPLKVNVIPRPRRAVARRRRRRIENVYRLQVMNTEEAPRRYVVSVSGIFRRRARPAPAAGSTGRHHADLPGGGPRGPAALRAGPIRSCSTSRPSTTTRASATKNRPSSCAEEAVPLAMTAKIPWYRRTLALDSDGRPAGGRARRIVTVWLAVATEDGVVADDYYKRGLAINQTIAREEAGCRRRLPARVIANPSGDRLRVYLTAAPGTAQPAAVRLRLVHRRARASTSRSNSPLPAATSRAPSSRCGPGAGSSSSRTARPPGGSRANGSSPAGVDAELRPATGVRGD